MIICHHNLANGDTALIEQMIHDPYPDFRFLMGQVGRDKMIDNMSPSTEIVQDSWTTQIFLHRGGNDLLLNTSDSPNLSKYFHAIYI